MSSSRPARSAEATARTAQNAPRRRPRMTPPDRPPIFTPGRAVIIGAPSRGAPMGAALTPQVNEIRIKADGSGEQTHHAQLDAEPSGSAFFDLGVAEGRVGREPGLVLVDQVGVVGTEHDDLVWGHIRIAVPAVV